MCETRFFLWIHDILGSNWMEKQGAMYGFASAPPYCHTMHSPEDHLILFFSYENQTKKDGCFVMRYRPERGTEEEDWKHFSVFQIYQHGHKQTNVLARRNTWVDLIAWFQRYCLGYSL